MLPDPEKPAQPALKVLIVDDNRSAAEVLASALEVLGQVPRVAFDGNAALEALADFAADLVILDIGLPGMDGFDVARAIRANPASRSVHIVALSGWGRPEDRRLAAEAGFDRHFSKPIGLDELEQMLDATRARLRA
ncbi:MAG TPA: response regulator [Candidatus Saccharimonadia bacterium]|nr:response regulator [Candidatus Saccharimonadia bacterium]